MEKVFELFPKLEERKFQGAYSLSGGEQQMLVIGRALMTNPKLLILDEATSSVDTQSEQLIQRAIEKLTEGRSTCSRSVFWREIFSRLSRRSRKATCIKSLKYSSKFVLERCLDKRTKP